MSQPSLIRVAELVPGDAVDGLLMVETVNFKLNRAGRPFLQLFLRDQAAGIKALQWETDRELYKSIRASDIVEVKGRIEEFQGKRQLIVDRLKRVPAETAPWHLFLPEGAGNVEELWKELESEIDAVERPELRTLLKSLLEDPAVGGALKSHPAGKSLHHAYRGGLLEHIVSIMGSARNLVTRWPALNLDVLKAGALLHDLGKTRELSCDRGIQYTDEGQLVGHVPLGLRMLYEKVEAIPDFPGELLMELEHLIVSHHGKVEFGAVREPMTAEAIALHFLDNLDARLAAYFTLAQSDEPSPYGENWTNLHPMFGARLYRPQRLREKNQGKK